MIRREARGGENLVFDEGHRPRVVPDRVLTRDRIQPEVVGAIEDPVLEILCRVYGFAFRGRRGGSGLRVCIARAQGMLSGCFS